VDRLVTVNGGTVTLSDTPGGGLTVTIGLPRRGAPATAPAADHRVLNQT
jgi:signal transduction histidine kinase